MARVLLLAVVLALAVGGGAAHADGAPARSPGTTLRAFVAAAGRSDAPAMWRLLSPQARRRLGPSLTRFRSHAAVELAEGAGTFARARDLRVVLTSRIDSRWAVAAVSGTRTAEGTREFAAYAVALRRSGSSWLVEPSSDPRLTPIGTSTSGRLATAPAQLAVGIRGRARIVQAAMWVDGRGFPLQSGGTAATNVTAYGLPPRTARGRHVVVAFASTAAGANALAWTFTVR